jgi:hypothetical protein
MQKKEILLNTNSFYKQFKILKSFRQDEGRYDEENMIIDERKCMLSSRIHQGCNSKATKYILFGLLLACCLTMNEMIRIQDVLQRQGI